MRSVFGAAETPLRLITTADTPAPEVQLLSNGRYHVMLTNAGAGDSRWKDLAVTRWREDTTCDEWGSFCYLRDTETGTYWSTTHQPTQWTPDSYEAIFSEGRAEFRRRDQGIDTYTEIVVSPEDDIELRRLRITNLSRTQRSIEVTSYAEVVIAPAAADAQHPAFSKLFVQTEALAEPAALLCTRRPRSADEHPPHMFHLMAVHGAKAGAVSHETDRSRFIGRGRSLHAPQAMREPGALSGSAGSVLDPVVATRRVITLEPGQTATIDIVYGMAETRDACVALAAEVCRPAAGRPGVRPLVDAQPGRPAPDQRQRGRCAALRAAGQHDRLFTAGPARQCQHAAAQLAAANRGCGATPSRATCRSCCCRSATQPTSTWSSRWCRRTPSGD